MPPLAITEGNVWRPGIGDPTVFGWLITFEYSAATALCAYAWRRELHAKPTATDRLHPRFWLVLCIVMFLLGINKQLDLQTLFTQIGRNMARSEGWYVTRARVQIDFIIGMACLALVTTVIAWVWVRRAWRRYAMAIGGIAFLGWFVLVRASSFHHVDTLLFHLPLLQNAVNRLLEAGGIALIAVAAARAAGRTQ